MLLGQDQHILPRLTQARCRAVAILGYFPPWGKDKPATIRSLNARPFRRTICSGKGRTVPPKKEQRAERRLAAIFAADVAGYSRLMSQDEAGTLLPLLPLARSWTG